MPTHPMQRRYEFSLVSVNPSSVEIVVRSKSAQMHQAIPVKICVDRDREVKNLRPRKCNCLKALLSQFHKQLQHPQIDSYFSRVVQH